MAEPNVSVQTQREAPFLEDYRRRLLESSFKKADVPTTTPGRDIADLDLFEKATYNYVQHANSFTNSNNPEVRFKYFKSIIAVQNSLTAFSNQIKENHPKIKYKVK